MNLAVIPARCGSKRVPNKNVKSFHGRPIISYSIATARESGLFDEIVVSTDSQDYAAVAKQYGAKVHMRPAKLADDITGTQEVARSALMWWGECHPDRVPEYACCIYATAPLMTATDLRQGYAGLRSQETWSYVYSTGRDFVDAGQWYWGRARAFLDGVPLAGNSILYQLPSERVCDINTEEDWISAELRYKEMQYRWTQKKSQPFVFESHQDG